MKKNSQVLLDFILGIIILGILVIGITRIWTWFNVQYAHRSAVYQWSRSLAGNVTIYNPTNATYVDINATSQCPGCRFHPIELTKEWVFRGIYSGDIISPYGGGIPRYNPQECYNETSSPGGPCSSNFNCTAGSSTYNINRNYGDCSDCGSGENFNENCAAFRRCTCYKNNWPLVCLKQQQFVDICGVDQECGDDVNATTDGCPDVSCTQDSNKTCAECNETHGTGKLCCVIRNRQELNIVYQRCNNPWESCWWVGFGRTAREVLRGIERLDQQIVNLRQDGLNATNQRDQILNCCNDPDPQAQTECLSNIPPFNCNEEVTNYISEWVKFKNFLSQLAGDDGNISRSRNRILDRVEACDWCMHTCNTGWGSSDLCWRVYGYSDPTACRIAKRYDDDKYDNCAKNMNDIDIVWAPNETNNGFPDAIATIGKDSNPRPFRYWERTEPPDKSCCEKYRLFECINYTQSCYGSNPPTCFPFTQNQTNTCGIEEMVSVLDNFRTQADQYLETVNHKLNSTTGANAKCCNQTFWHDNALSKCNEDCGGIACYKYWGYSTLTLCTQVLQRQKQRKCLNCYTSIDHSITEIRTCVDNVINQNLTN